MTERKKIKRVTIVFEDGEPIFINNKRIIRDSDEPQSPQSPLMESEENNKYGGGEG